MAALCSGLVACGRVLPAVALLQFDPSQPAGAPAELLLQHTARAPGALCEPADLPFVECLWSAHTLEAALCALHATRTPRPVLQCVEGMLAAAPMRELAAARAQEDPADGQQAKQWTAAQALAGEGAPGPVRTREWCLLRTMQLLAVGCVGV